MQNTSITNFEKISITLNRFFVKQLEVDSRTFYEYKCRFQEVPEQRNEQQVISSICYKLGVIAVRFGHNIITSDKVSLEKMNSDNWQLELVGTKELSCQKPFERKVLETFERRRLEKQLKSYTKTEVTRATEGGLIWWITAQEGVEKFGNGWEVHRGRRIDIAINSDNNLYLEIDIYHRFHTPWTLQKWLDKYPDIPISYVRNNYKDKKNKYINWKYESMSDQLPQELIIEELGESLANYHSRQGATESEIQTSRVVYVKKANQWNAKPLPHLSQRLSPSLTLDMLANLAENQKLVSEERSEVQSVFSYIKKNLDERLKEAKKTAERIIEGIYEGSSDFVQALQVDGYTMPPAKLIAANNQQVKQAAHVRYKGCVKVGETKFGCLNLFNNSHKYPEEVQKCLKDIATKSSAKININSYRTLQDLPPSDLDQRMFWQSWADEGIKTVLVVMPWSPNERKQKIRIQALQAGVATQFIVPQPKADKYKALNVVLGLLCKAGWQPIHLEPFKHPDTADLIIGFDTGTNRELYYGTSAFAILADGQSLGWELPDVQRGETFSGQAIWQTVSKLILKFHKICHCYPKKVLLMRDGLIQEGEFQQTIKALEEQKIAVDVIGVRKSGAGRMGCEVKEDEKIVYRDAQLGSIVFFPNEKSFILVTSQPINNNIGSARPLRVVHDYGNTPLDILALQTYHLTQLHPASGFRSCRLPWVLHLADRSSKEFQRIKQISILQNLDREKLIAV